MDPWQFATDSGLFDGRWDDQLGQFRTLYTSDSLVGCFLELLAKLQLKREVQAEIDEVEDDDGSVSQHTEGGPGEVGYRWLEGRAFGTAYETGRYAFITHSLSIAALKARYPFGRYGIALSDVDTGMLKDAYDRVLTRSIARWIYDLQGDDVGELVDGVEFRSRHGDEIRMWAVFERSDDDQHSRHIAPQEEPVRVTDETPELLEAMRRLGLRWTE